MELTAEPCSPVRVEHAEGPFWYGDRLGWVDIMAGRLWVAGYDGATLTGPRSYDVGRPLGAAAIRRLLPCTGGPGDRGDRAPDATSCASPTASR